MVSEGHDDLFGLGNPIDMSSFFQEDVKIKTNEEIDKLFKRLPNIDDGLNQEDFEFVLKKVLNYSLYLIKKDKHFVENSFGQLSAREVLSLETTFYMNPCLDLTFVVIQMLKKCGFQDINMILHEIRSRGKQSLHFGLSLVFDDQTYYVDYRQNCFMVEKENFKKQYPMLGKSLHDGGEHIINARDISIDDSIYTLLDKKLFQFKYFDKEAFAVLTNHLKGQHKPEVRSNYFDRLIHQKGPNVVFVYQQDSQE